MLTSSRASRIAAPGPVLAWVMVTGFAITAPFALASSTPPRASIGWLAIAGVGNTIGLLLEYTAVRSGKVGIVAAIASTEGAVAAVIATIAGEVMTAATGAVLALITTGVVLAALGQHGDVEGTDQRPTRAVFLAIGAAAAFGVGLYAAGRVSNDVSLAWIVLPARLVGVLVVALPLAARRKIRIQRSAAPLVIVAGVAEVAGIASFALGARQAIGITSVLGSQFAALAAIGAFLFFGERLRRIQLAGVVAILFGVAALAAMRAGA